MKEVRFREQFNAAVVAVARKGERLVAKPGDIVIQASDILLLDTGASFASRHKDSKYFSIVSLSVFVGHEGQAALLCIGMQGLLG